MSEPRGEFVQTRRMIRVQPLLDELGVECQNRYGELHRTSTLMRLPGTDFEPPTGYVILGIVDGLAVAGAFAASIARRTQASGHRRR
jgi:hypothetical protein